MRRFSRKWAPGSGALVFRSGDPGADRFPTVQELRPLFERELRRARRYDRPLSVLVLALRATEETDDPPASPPDLLGELLQDALRETDLVGCLRGTGEYAALLPEADAPAAARGAERLRKLWGARNAAALAAGAATYPADGLVVDDLLERARHRSSGLVVLADRPAASQGDSASA